MPLRLAEAPHVDRGPPQVKKKLQLIEALLDDQTAPQADRGPLRPTEGPLGPKGSLVQIVVPLD